MTRFATSIFTTRNGQPRIYVNGLGAAVPYGTRVFLYPSGSTFEVGFRSTSPRFGRADAWDAADEALSAAGLSYGDSWEAVVAAATGTASRNDEYVPNAADWASLAEF